MASRGQSDTAGELAVALPRTRALPAVRPRWWLDALVIVWLLWIYDAVNNLAPVRQRAALAHGMGVLHLERILHLDPERTLNRWLVGHHTLGLALSYYYDNAHFIVTLGLLGWLWWKRADLYRPLRNSLVLINLIGLAVFWRYPVAPPRMLAGFNDVVAASGTIGSWHTGSLAKDANQLAAMPSLHIAWAVWCSLALWLLARGPADPAHPPRARTLPAPAASAVGGRATRRALRAAAILYPCLTAFAVLATGNHYLLDLLAGLATAALAVLLARVAGYACHKLVTKSQFG
jgi:hypothetical protein